jgi:hypothetical protein
VSAAVASHPVVCSSVDGDLDAQGFAVLPGLLGADVCHALAALYDTDELFRSRVVMERHAFGRGEYKYFAYPLPPVVQALRDSLYASLVPTANRWAATLGNEPYPPRLRDFLARCHGAGQERPTPLLLSYGEGDYNCLHQDLYGELSFPLQVACLLSEPERDFSGGEFVMTEQRPRMQSRPMVVPLGLGDAAIITTAQRPFKGSSGYYRVNLRHAVSRVRGGERIGMELSFHDAPRGSGDQRAFIMDT